jgi:polyhydroxybutyrate depolymerase
MAKMLYMGYRTSTVVPQFMWQKTGSTRDGLTTAIEISTLFASWLITIKDGLCVDNSRVFAAGFSFGGMMSNTIECQMGELFRAVAPMSGSLWSGCAESESKVATIMMHAKDDSVVGCQYAQEARDKFLSKNGCGSERLSIGTNGFVEYLGCDSEYPVVWCGSEYGGHWPKLYVDEENKTFVDHFKLITTT